MSADQFIDNGAVVTAPAYQQQRIYRSFWRVSDRADSSYQDQYDARGMRIMPPHARESESAYATRLNKAIARPYVRPIINRYNDHATRQPVERPDGGDAYNLWLRDVDGMMTNMDEFLARTGRMAQIEGTSAVLMDDTRTGDSQADQTGGVVSRLIHADQILNWREWQGEIQEALILLEDPNGVMFLWYVGPDYVQRINIKQPTRRQRNLVSIRGISSPLSFSRIEVTSFDEQEPHNWLGVPVKRVWPFRSDSECAGDTSQAGPIAESQKRLANFESYLREEIEGATFTWNVLSGVDSDQVKDISIGVAKFMCLPDPGSSAQRLGADASQAASIRESITQEVRELYRVAGLSPGDPLQASAPESGVAKAFAFNEIEATLSKLTSSLQQTENWMTAQWTEATGSQYPGEAKWPTKFDTPNLTTELERAIRTISAPLPDSLKALETMRYADMAFRLDPQKRQQIQQEIRDQLSNNRLDTETNVSIGTQPT